MPLGGVARLSLILFCAGFALGCGADESTTTPKTTPDSTPEDGLLVLFIGNSLTTSNNLPALVETIAEVAGHTVDARRIATGGYSLEDHWNTRVGPRIREMEPDVVVMQQGPSSLPENQLYLLEWTEVLSEVIHEVGAVPALLMVWPEDTRLEAFQAVHDSYRNAASAVDGRFIPAGEAFLAAHRLEGLNPYSLDGFHPSHLGSVIAALSVVRTLYPDKLTDLPSALIPSDPVLPFIDLGSDAQTVYSLVEEAVTEFGF